MLWALVAARPTLSLALGQESTHTNKESVLLSQREVEKEGESGSSFVSPGLY